MIICFTGIEDLEIFHMCSDQGHILLVLTEGKYVRSENSKIGCALVVHTICAHWFRPRKRALFLTLVKVKILKNPITCP